MKHDPYGTEAYEVRLEEIRANLNASFGEVIVARERGDEDRLYTQRTAWEKRKTGGNQKDRIH